MDRQARERAMIKQIVEADFGDGSPDRLDALDAFIDQDPDRAALHASVMDLWDDLGELDPPALARERKPWVLPRPWLAAASIILPVIGVGLLMLATSIIPASHEVRLRTGGDERRIVSLSDGSTVSLSPDTLLVTAMERDRRVLRLERGEALFEVAHDPNRPFLVDVGGGQVQAIGTTFNIRKDEDVVVTVVEGVVRVTVGEKRLGASARLSQTASAGHQIHMGEQDVSGAPGATSAYLSPARRVDAERYASWTKGVLQFEGEPLSKVIDELTRYSANKVELTDPSKANIPIYGTLHIGDAEGLRALIRDLQPPRSVPPSTAQSPPAA